MKIVISVILLTLVHVKAFTQRDLIKWNNNVKITWSDFKGKADVRSAFGAMSAVGIYYKYNSASKGKRYIIRFTIYSGFDKTKSWRRTRLLTMQMLKHEQLHFDIAELVSRAFKNEAEHTVYTENYKNEISRIFNRYTLFMQKLQRKYDVQTMHSNNKEKQKDWENLIRQELLK